MITTQVVAEVRRVLRGDADRALVHAVDGEGLEYKIEVPLDQVRALSSEQGHVVTISYAIHTLPGLAPPTAETTDPGDAGAEAPTPPAAPASEAPPPAAGAASGATSDPASVDAAFMTLMNRRSAAGSPTALPSSLSGSTAAQPASQAGSPEPPAGGPTSAARPSLDAMVDELLGRR